MPQEKEWCAPKLTEAFATDVTAKNEGHRDAPAAPEVQKPAALERKGI